MINKLAKDYSKTLLTLFIVSNVGPIVSRTISDVKLDNWQHVASYIFSIAAAISITYISFFTNTEAPIPNEKV